MTPRQARMVVLPDEPRELFLVTRNDSPLQWCGHMMTVELAEAMALCWNAVREADLAEDED